MTGPSPSLVRGSFWALLALLPIPVSGQASSGSSDQARAIPAAGVEYLESWANRRLQESDPDATDTPTRVERLWALYFLAVQEESHVEPAQEALRSLRTEASDAPDALQMVEALAGAIQVIRAKHAFWPPSKLKHLRRGLEALDRLVQARPREPAIRYLRLVSCYYLPFFLEREESVEEDFQALVRLLPAGPGAFPPSLFPGVVTFVLQEWEMTPGERAELEALL